MARSGASVAKLSDAGVSIEHMDATLLLIAVITLAAGAVIGWLAAGRRGQAAVLAAQHRLQAAEGPTHAARADVAGPPAPRAAAAGGAAGRPGRPARGADRAAAPPRGAAEVEAKEQLREAFHSLA